jgi:uncharacterized membrane protein
MSKLKEYAAVFTVGAIIYSLIEIVSRGYTHWTMALLGGIVLILMYQHFNDYPEESLFKKCIFGCITITCLEFTTGCIVNILLGWNVWDYSERHFDLFGQICPWFSMVWFFVTIPAVYVCKYLNVIITLLKRELAQSS